MHYLRYYISGMIAGLMGMAAGMAGQIYIYEFTNRPVELLQATVVFREIDELSFFVSFVSVMLFLFSCLAVEVKRYIRKCKVQKKEPVEKRN